MPFPLLEPVVELIWLDRRPVILFRLPLFFDLFQIGFHPADELGIYVLVDPIYLAVEYPEALLVIPPNPIQNLEPFALRRGRRQNYQAYPELVLEGPIIQPTAPVALADELDAIFVILLQAHAP